MKSILFPAFGAATLCAAAPALAADQFNLACQGLRTTVSGGAAEAYGFTARVDLAAKKWCMDQCQSAQPIMDVTPEKIVFTDDGTLNTRLEVSTETVLDRKSGAFRHFMMQVRPTEAYLKIEANCTEAPFTSLPADAPAAG